MEELLVVDVIDAKLAVSLFDGLGKVSRIKRLNVVIVSPEAIFRRNPSSGIPFVIVNIARFAFCVILASERVAKYTLVKPLGISEVRE